MYVVLTVKIWEFWVLNVVLTTKVILQNDKFLSLDRSVITLLPDYPLITPTYSPNYPNLMFRCTVVRRHTLHAKNVISSLQGDPNTIGTLHTKYLWSVHNIPNIRGGLGLRNLETGFGCWPKIKPLVKTCEVWISIPHDLTCVHHFPGIFTRNMMIPVLITVNCVTSTLMMGKWRWNIWTLTMLLNKVTVIEPGTDRIRKYWTLIG